jgi:hypothetical protein
MSTLRKCAADSVNADCALGDSANRDGRRLVEDD